MPEPRTTGDGILNGRPERRPTRQPGVLTDRGHHDVGHGAEPDPSADDGHQREHGGGDGRGSPQSEDRPQRDRDDDHHRGQKSGHRAGAQESHGRQGQHAGEDQAVQQHSVTELEQQHQARQRHGTAERVFVNEDAAPRSVIDANPIARKEERRDHAQYRGGAQHPGHEAQELVRRVSRREIDAEGGRAEQRSGTAERHVRRHRPQNRCGGQATEEAQPPLPAQEPHGFPGAPGQEEHRDRIHGDPGHLHDTVAFQIVDGDAGFQAEERKEAARREEENEHREDALNQAGVGGGGALARGEALRDRSIQGQSVHDLRLSTAIAAHEATTRRTFDARAAAAAPYHE